MLWASRFSVSVGKRCLPCALVVGLLAIDVSAGDHEEMVEGGRQIFQRQWAYQPPVLEELTTGLNDAASRLRLSGLPGDGLGPMHNANSCESCHAGGGAADVDRNVTLLTLDPRYDFPSFRPPREKAAIASRQQRIRQTRQAVLDLYPALLSPSGVLSLDVVVHEKSARPLYDEIRDNIGKHVAGGAPDEWFRSQQRTSRAIAEQPVLAGRMGELDFYLSQRNSPPLFGLGLIDQIDHSRLHRLAESQNRHSRDGVSGRVGAGRFGWRAQTSTLDQFVRGACAGEVGLQLSSTPQPPDAADETYFSPGVDLSEREVMQLVSYVGSLPKPVQDTRLPEGRIAAIEGNKLFTEIGCNACHVETIHPARGIYSDLLLHDMGDLLQAPSPAPLGTFDTMVSVMSIPRFPAENPAGGTPSRRGFGSSLASYYGTPSTAIPRPYRLARPLEPRFPRGRVPDHVINPKSVRAKSWDALQREWRTPPLWGVADTGPYLHDGRATTLDAAIRWHGGEAAASATRYRSLTDPDRKKIIAFLSSLRAPDRSVRKKLHRTAIVASFVPVEDHAAKELQRLAEAVNVFD